MDVETIIVTDINHGVSTALANVWVGPTIFDSLTGVGGSRCAPGDTFDPTIGETLAVSRALRDVARQLDKVARAKVADQDRIVQSQKAARQRNLGNKKKPTAEQIATFRAIAKENKDA
jgi:hypothetical protein